MSGPTGRAHDDAESLVELLVSVAILGVVIVAIIEVLFTMVGGSAARGDDARVQNLLGTWAESIGGRPYTACADSDAVRTSSPAPVLPPGYFPDVVAVGYWNGSSFGSACTPATDTGLELITLAITSAEGQTPSVAATMQVVKRRPCESGC